MKSLGKVAAVSSCAFVAILGGLSLQMAAGQDPALGPKAQQLAATRSQQPQKKVIKRTVIVRKVYPEEQEQSAGPSESYGGYSASAPATSAPAQTYSAPAPAPVATSTS